MARSRNIAMQHVDKYGNTVAADDPKVAFQVNPNDSSSREFIESLQRKNGTAPVPGSDSANVLKSGVNSDSEAKADTKAAPRK